MAAACGADREIVRLATMRTNVVRCITAIAKQFKLSPGPADSIIADARAADSHATLLAALSACMKLVLSEGSDR